MNGKSGQKVNGKSGQCEHWNRLPDSVLYDVELSAVARLTYAVLAGAVHQGATVKMGQRLIAKRLGFHQETIGLALLELKDRGHIEIRGDGRHRRLYVLHSDVFGQKQRAGVSEVRSTPRGSRLVSVAKEDCA